jgi:hypothetical protein
VTAVYGFGQPVFIVIAIFCIISIKSFFDEIPIQVILIGPLPGLN